MSATLWVYLDEHRVGRLERTGAQLRFTYDSGDARPVSVRLPTRTEPYDDAECRPFFANLLPEGLWRQSLCRSLGIAVDDDFALLGAIGADCAGAIAVTPDAKWRHRAGKYVATTEANLRKWVKNPEARPQIRITPGLRLSVAGVQDKLLIHIDGHRPYLCEGGAPSTVIVKPDIRDRRSGIALLSLNELVSMTLAGLSGISVPRAFWFASAYAVERFDRVVEGTRFRRLHQEDFAQVLGLSPTEKYGVTWKQCFDLMSAHATTPASSRIQLVDRLLYNLILGNNDAHAKNFALLHQSTGIVELSPAYDLVCTEMYPSLSPNLAMPIGTATTLKNLSTPVWKAFARDVGIGFPLLRQRGVELCRKVEKSLEESFALVMRGNPALARDIYPLRRRSDFFRSFSKLVAANCNKLARSFGAPYRQFSSKLI